MGDATIAQGVALELRKGGSLDDIHQLFLIHKPSNVVEWLDEDLSVNLLQLSILNERFDIFQYLILQYPVFLDNHAIYRAANYFTDIENDQLLLNAPLHLACYIGNMEIVRYLLSNKQSGTLCTVSLVNLSYEADESSIKAWRKVKRSAVNLGKPFEFCVIGGNIECMDYLLTNHIIQCLALRFLYAGVREPSSLLHKACSIGNPQMIKTLLDRSFKDVLCLCDKNGKTPLHIASWNGDTQSMRLLLENGANVNCLTESRNCLHILFRSKLHPYNYKVNTELLLEYGIDYQAVDKNGKSALHVLCEEIGISRVDVMCYWRKAADSITDMTRSSSPSQQFVVEAYQRDLLACLELLLQKGIDPNKVTNRSCGNQTPIEVVLQYSLLPYSNATLWLNPEVVYEALELLMQHGADPNLESRVMNGTLFSQFLVNHMFDIGKEMRGKFINLFFQYGANLDIAVGPLDLPLSPVVSVMENLHDFETLKVILNYLPLSHFQKILNQVPSLVIPRLIIKKENRDSDRSRDPEIADEAFWAHIGSLKDLVKNGGMRNLKHTCKLRILDLLGRKGYLVQKLPLPNFIKNYLENPCF